VPGARQVTHRDVDALALQVEHAVVGGDAHIDLGAGAAELAQARDQPQRAERHGGGQRDPLPVGARREAVDRVLDLAQRGVHRSIQAVAFVGEDEAAALAHEQPHPQTLFQRLDLAAHRGLREVQLVGGAGEIQVPRGRLEALQQVQRRHGAGLLRHSVCSWLAFRDLACPQLCGRAQSSP
jgi:hypothetical protein